MTQLWVLSLLGCSTIDSISNTPDCDPRVLDSTEVRVRPILCGDEEIPSGDGRRGDFILENNQIRLTLRAPGTSLSQIDGNGATIVDIVPVSEQANGDVVMEMWLSDTDTHPTQILGWSPLETGNGVQIDTVDGAIEVWLMPDDPMVYVTPSIWTLRPSLETELYGQQIHSALHQHAHILQFQADQIEDFQGDVLFHDLQEISVLRNSNAGSVDIEVPEGTAEGIDWIDLFDESNTRLGRVWANDIDSILQVSPSVANIEVGRSGCRSIGLQPVSTTLNWTVSECGSIGLRLQDDDGPIEGWTSIQGNIHFIPEEGLILPLIDLDTPITVWSGMSHEPEKIQPSDITLEAHPRLSLYLPKRFEPSAALHTVLDAAPSTTTRSLQSPLHQSAGLQANHQIVASADSVLRLDSNTLPERIIDPENIQIGLLSDQFVLSWPWRANLQGGFGALNPNVMTDNELLTQASAQNRLTASIGVSTTDPNSLDDPLWTTPDFQWIHNPTLDEIRRICSWTHPRPLGVWTWLDHEDVDPNYSLLELAYSTGNGPRLSLSPVFNTDRSHRLEFSIQSTDWMNLEYWELWSDQGLEDAGNIDNVLLSIQQVYPNRKRWCLIAWGANTHHPFDEAMTWAARILE